MIWTDHDDLAWEIVDYVGSRGARKKVELGHRSAEGRAFIPIDRPGPTMLYPFGLVAQRGTDDRNLASLLSGAKPADASAGDRMQRNDAEPPASIPSTSFDRTAGPWMAIASFDIPKAAADALDFSSLRERAAAAGVPIATFEYHNSRSRPGQVHMTARAAMAAFMAEELRALALRAGERHESATLAACTHGIAAILTELESISGRRP